jgi:L-gulonolactone oxidase
MKKLTLALGALLTLGVALKSCGKENANSSVFSAGVKPEAKAKFSNYNNSVVCNTGVYLEASSDESIQEAIRYASEKNLTLRPVSQKAPHSYSSVICPADNGFVLNLQSLNKIVSIDSESLTVTVQPGIKIAQLQEQLHTKGFAFAVSPDYNGVSVAGAMGTGAHHSSLKIQSSVSDYVVSMNLIDGLGNKKTLSGSELNTAKVHLGLLGVITQLTLKIEPQFKLQLGIEKGNDTNIGTELLEKVRKNDYARVRWFAGQSKFVMDTLNKVDVSTVGESFDEAWINVPNLKPLGDLPTNVLNNSKIASCSAELVRATTFGGTIKKIGGSSNANAVGFSHKMMAGGCEEGKCPWDKGVSGRTLEVAFPASKFESWTKDVKSILAVTPACFPTNGLYLRFSKKSEGALAQAFNEDMVAFEIHIATTKNPSNELWSDVYDEIVQMTLSKYNGRPHWGKNSTPYFLNVGENTYPKWNEFKELKNKLDPKSVFESKLWKDITNKKIEFTGNEALNCGITRECFCKLQSSPECGSNATCSEGSFFKEARVCRRK